MRYFHSWCKAIHILLQSQLCFYWQSSQESGGSYIDPLPKSTLICILPKILLLESTNSAFTFGLVVDSKPSPSLLPWRQISSENRMTLKPYWDWMTLKAHNTDTNISMMHSSTTFFALFANGMSDNRRIAEAWGCFTSRHLITTWPQSLHKFAY